MTNSETLFWKFSTVLYLPNTGIFCHRYCALWISSRSYVKFYKNALLIESIFIFALKLCFIYAG